MNSLKRIVLALGPLVILGGAIAVLFIAFPFEAIEAVEEVDPIQILWLLTLIGAIAGIVPVTIGMLWYPFLRTLSIQWIHAVLALSAGVLAFAGWEMIAGIIDHGGAHPLSTMVVAGVGTAIAFGVLVFVRRWRTRAVATGTELSGIQVAYIIAIGLGLHSIGEGLAIGTAFVAGDARLVALLVVAFLLDNVSEGPTIVAAVASEVDRPPLLHFALLGIVAGSPVIIGGWIGSLAATAMVIVLFLAIGLGAILEVIWEIIRFISSTEGDSIRAAGTLRNITAFLAGFVLMVLIDELIIDMMLL